MVCYEKTSCELEEIKEDLCKAQEKVQEYLDTNEDELLSQVSRFFRELCDLHSQEMKACQHMTEFKE